MPFFVETTPSPMVIAPDSTWMPSLSIPETVTFEIDEAAVLPSATTMPYAPPVGAVVPVFGVTVVVIVIGADAPLVRIEGSFANSKPDLPFGTCTVTAPVLDVTVTFAGIGIGNVSPAP